MSPLLWWMNEAELTAEANEAEIIAEVDASRIGWVQVGLQDGVEPVMALPALVQCFDDALRRFGNLELSGLQLTASDLQPSKGSFASAFFSELYWFITAPKARPEALVAFDSALLPGRTVSDLVASLGRMNGGWFEFGPQVAAVPEQHSIRVPVEAPVSVVLSPAQWGVSLKVPEWTASAAAWVLAIVIDKARAAAPGVRSFSVRMTRVQ